LPAQGDLGYEARRLPSAPGHAPRRRELRARVRARRVARHFRFQLARPAIAEHRPVSRAPRRLGAGAGHHQPGVRRLPHVLPRRHAAGVGLEPPWLEARRDQRLRGRLGRAPVTAPPPPRKSGPVPPPPPRPVPPAAVKTWRDGAGSGGKAIATALVIRIILRSYLIEAFRIPTGSMENTLLVGDFLFVNKAAYG